MHSYFAILSSNEAQKLFEDFASREKSLAVARLGTDRSVPVFSILTPITGFVSLRLEDDEIKQAQVSPKL